MEFQLNEVYKNKIMKTCFEIAGSRRIIAVCLYGPWVCGYADKEAGLNVLLIIDRFFLRFNNYHESINGVDISILAINCLDFERDVKKGLFGEFFSDKVTFPYDPLKNKEYLQLSELNVKKRIIKELLENLILEFPELSHDFFIKKEYFMYEMIMRKTKLFPPLVYSFLNILKREKNLKFILQGYQKALKQLETENVLYFSDGYVRITKNFIENITRKKLRLTPYLKSFQRMMMAPILSVFSESTNSFIQEQRLFFKDHEKSGPRKLFSKLDDPKKYIVFSTPLGQVSLSDKMNIIDIAKKVLPEGDFSNINIQRIGGVLNEVYVLILKRNGEKQKFIVKRFVDWSNIKWLSLSLWTLGTTNFSVLGKSRLEKEYTINKFLQSKGFFVPRIFYMSLKRRLLFQEFIHGKNLVHSVKGFLSSKNDKKDFFLIKEVGKKIAQAHGLGVSLGDCKPENFIVSNKEIFLLDLEQATRNGNKVWDIAEFLYFSGHFNPPLSSADSMVELAKIFIKGYLEAGGNKETVKKASLPRYIKAFSIFTPPHVLFAISNLCQKIEK